MIPIDDAISETHPPYTITTNAATGDAAYLGINAADITVNISDNDTPGVFVNQSPLTTSETGTSQTFQLNLNTQPTAPVSVCLYSSMSTESLIQTDAVAKYA